MYSLFLASKLCLPPYGISFQLMTWGKVCVLINIEVERFLCLMGFDLGQVCDGYVWCGRVRDLHSR